MLHRFASATALAVLAFFSFVAPAVSQPPQPPPTATLGGYVAAPATTASARVALPVARTPFFTITLYNSGSNAAYFAVGDVTVVATTANTILRAGTRLTVWASGTHVAVITASSTSTVDIYQSNGPIDFGLVGGGGGGTAADITVGTTTVTGGVSGNVLYNNAGTLGTLSTSTTVNGQVCTLGSTCTITASATSITVGSTTISGGTTTNILRNNAGVLAEYTITGTGTVVAMQTSPSLVTPALGVATATSVAIGGGAIGADALEITGSTTHNGAVVIASSSFSLSGNQSAAAWTTSGIRYKNVAATFTDTTSSGTVALAYTNVFGGSTIAASAATTYTQYVSTYFANPIAGTNVTMTNKSALGADSISIGGAAQGTNALAVTGTVDISGNTTLGSSAALLWSTDLKLFRDAANTLALRNSTTAQTLRVYNSFTDASNGSWGTFNFGDVANALTIGTKSNGSGIGVPVKMQFVIEGVNKFDYGVTTAGKWTFSANIAVSGNINMTGGGTSFAASNVNFAFDLATRAFWSFPADGVVTIANNAGTSFDRLQLGGTTSAFGAINRDGAGIRISAADGTTAGPLSISGSALTVTASALGMAKMTASASAPGAAGSKLEVVCGTNAGSAKLVMYAGTSGTAVTVVDNVGTGVTGC